MNVHGRMGVFVKKQKEFVLIKEVNILIAQYLGASNKFYNMDKSGKRLLESISKLRECFASTTAALSPYPTSSISSKKKRVWRVEGGPEYYAVKCSDGSMIKQSWKSKEAAQKVCDKYNAV